MVSRSLQVCLFLVFFVHILSAEDCNSTHLEFFGKYSLGKQDQLNRTFTALQEQIKISNATYKMNDFTSFNITNIAVSFFYLDSKQKAEIVGNNTIMIVGGRVETILSFDWVKHGLAITQNGTVRALIGSQEIFFEKQISMEKGYFDYILADYYNVTIEFSNFTLLRVEPPTTSQNDKTFLLKVLNDKSDSQVKPLKSLLQEQINSKYSKQLQLYLKNEHYNLENSFVYEWRDEFTGKSEIINFKMFNTGVTLNQQGLSITYVMNNQQDAGWKCGALIPSQPLSPFFYGELQEFIEFSVFENTIRYSLEKNYLDSDLTRRNWQSRMFQFFVGDLYEVIPGLTAQFTASDIVTGNCIYNPQKTPTITKYTNNTIHIVLEHTCSMAVRSTTIAEFNLLLTAEVEPSVNATHLNWKVKAANGQPMFKDVGKKYEVKNFELAYLMIQHSLNRLKQGWVFGSGWKIFPRDYPHVTIATDHVIIYDSSHIETSEKSTAQI